MMPQKIDSYKSDCTCLKQTIQEDETIRDDCCLLPGLIDAHIHVCLCRHPAVRYGTVACACVNPVLHCGIDVGLLRAGDDVWDSLKNSQVLQTVIRGVMVMEEGRSTCGQRRRIFSLPA